MNRSLVALSLFVAATVFVGCDKKPATSEFKGKNEGHKHDDKTTQDVALPDGKLAHVILTAHLDPKEGNELDAVFEMHDKDEPYPIPIDAKLSARVTRKGDDTPHTLEFKPAEKDERKTDPDGKCSRFTAEAKWMKPDDTLDVTLTIEYGGQTKKASYIGFVPKDSAHTHDDKKDDKK